jgi:hypothetical protein
VWVKEKITSLFVFLCKYVSVFLYCVCLFVFSFVCVFSSGLLSFYLSFCLSFVFHLFTYFYRSQCLPIRGSQNIHKDRYNKSPWGTSKI